MCILRNLYTKCGLVCNSKRAFSLPRTFAHKKRYICILQLHLYLTVTFVSYSCACNSFKVWPWTLMCWRNLQMNFYGWTGQAKHLPPTRCSDTVLPHPPLQAFHLQLLMKHINFNAEAFVELSRANEAPHMKLMSCCNILCRVAGANVRHSITNANFTDTCHKQRIEKETRRGSAG